MIHLSNIPTVALDCLQQDHITVCNMINQLLADLTKDTNNQLIGQQLDTLIKHCVDHFFCEEKQMAAFSYPELTTHQAEHKNISTEIATIQTEWHQNNDRPSLHTYLQDRFTPWLIDHITRFDIEGTQFIYDAGGR